MKRWRLAAAVSIIAALMCIVAYNLIDRAFGSDDTQKLTLWYIEGDCTPGKLEKLKKQYNRTAGGERLKLAVRSFADEEALSVAFNSTVPDLLVCSYIRAGDFMDRGMLSEVESGDTEYPENILELMPTAGKSFFPIGSEVGLLVMNKKLCAEAGLTGAFASLQELTDYCNEYMKKTGKQFFSAESYASLINAAMCSLDAPFSGNIRKDAYSSAFKTVYNLLAECGYEGSLMDAGTQSAQYVSEGLLPCAYVPSTRLNSLSGKGISLALLPLPENGEKACPAELVGIAVTSTDSEKLSSASAFLEWLNEDGRCDELAMASALLPLGTPEQNQKVYWEALLTELEESFTLRYMNRGSSFIANHSDFDASFSTALDLLE